MEIRDARSSDADGIRSIARESFDATYGEALDEDAIDRLIDAEYAPEVITDATGDGTVVLRVAAEGDDVVGFVNGRIVDGDPVVGDVLWLHVRPDERGRGIGVQLLGQAIDEFEDNNAGLVRGHVIEANRVGGEFYEAQGFERVRTNEVEIAGDAHEEFVYETRLDDHDGGALVEVVDGPEGAELYVDYTAAETGTAAPLYPVYSERPLEEQHGWYCSNCGSVETTMDPSGRIQCADCENTRIATRWDRSYL